MDPPEPEIPLKKSDAQVEMLQQFTNLQTESQSLKSELSRLQKLLDEITCSNDSQRVCECNRKLRYISSLTQYKGYKCSKCLRQLVDVSNVWWGCAQCQYYVCGACQGYKRSVCPFSHFLEFSKYNPDIQKQEEDAQGEDLLVVGLERIKSKCKRKCDICLKQITSNFYICSCGFDMCKQCRDK